MLHADPQSRKVMANAIERFDYAIAFHIRVVLMIACGKIRAGDFRLTLIWLGIFMVGIAIRDSHCFCDQRFPLFLPPVEGGRGGLLNRGKVFG